MNCPLHLQKALTESLSSGLFIDTKFYAFSKRDSSGRVYEPKALYASSTILKRTPYFETLLSDVFSEGTSKNLAADFPDTEPSYRDDYEYSSDEDLELEDVSEDREVTASTVSLPDSDLVEVKEACTSQPETRSTSDAIKIDVNSPQVPKVEDIKNSAEKAKLGKVVIIKDAAFSTLYALLLYLYTDEIEFTPFGSEKSVPSFSTVPRASPKSIYRLADKYDLTALKRLALTYICANLASCDIVGECFSRFTSHYNEIRDAQVKHLSTVLRTNSESESVMGPFKEKVQEYARGRTPYVAEALTALFENLAQEAPLYTGALILSPLWKIDLVKLKKVLANSMTSGVFLDATFYARSSRSSVYGQFKVQPIYVSRALVGQHFPIIQIHATRHEFLLQGNSIISSAEVDEYDSDSDIDDEDGEMVRAALSKSPSVPTSAPDSEAPGNGSAREPGECGELMQFGALRTWEYLFFHLYTDAIHFAPLRSQGLETRLIALQRNVQDSPHRPQSCSPKSLYAIADKIDLPNLKARALKDLQDKLQSSSVVTEIFSKFTSANRGVMTMESERLIKDFLNKECIESVKQKINTMGEGEFSHRADPLISIFTRLSQNTCQRCGRRLASFLFSFGAQMGCSCTVHIPAPTLPSTPQPVANARKGRRSGGLFAQ